MSEGSPGNLVHISFIAGHVVTTSFSTIGWRLLRRHFAARVLSSTHAGSCTVQFCELCLKLASGAGWFLCAFALFFKESGLSFLRCPLGIIYGVL